MTKPNIILFVGEDTGRHQRCYGDPFARTPHIDRLAAEGCLFTNAFSTAPVSAPSRSALITGQFAPKFGSHHMRSTVLNPPRLFTEELQDAGYYVNWSNKTDFNFEPPETLANEKDEAWIERLENGQTPDEPWFLYYNYGATHESRMWPPGQDPAAAAPADEPGFDDALLEGITVPPYLPDTKITRSALFRYYRNLANQDAVMGRILDALDRHRLADNTIVIYMSDHGRGQVREKRWLYDAGFHLPLIVRAPGMTTPGSFRDDLVSWVDMAPTFHSLAGIDIPERYDGRVFLGDQTQDEPDCVFGFRDRMDEGFDRVRAARDRRYLYIRNDFPDRPWAQRLLYMENSPVTRQLREMHAAGETSFPTDVFMAERKPNEELYDTVADPHCVHNLAGEANCADVLKRLREATKANGDRINDLGFVSEKQLIADGIVKDRMEEYGKRIKPLPEHLRAGGRLDTELLEPGT